MAREQRLAEIEAHVGSTLLVGPSFVNGDIDADQTSDYVRVFAGAFPNVPQPSQRPPKGSPMRSSSAWASTTDR